MIWICIISVIQNATGNYTISKSQVKTVAPAVAAEMSKQCDARPDCVEPRPGFYVIDTTPPKADHAPAVPQRRVTTPAPARSDEA